MKIDQESSAYLEVARTPAASSSMAILAVLTCTIIWLILSHFVDDSAQVISKGEHRWLCDLISALAVRARAARAS